MRWGDYIGWLSDGESGISMSRAGHVVTRWFGGNIESLTLQTGQIYDMEGNHESGTWSIRADVEPIEGIGTIRFSGGWKYLEEVPP